MLITNRNNTDVGVYDGFTTNLLIGQSNSGSKEISMQITNVEPNGMQFLHRHKEEQCYYIIAGKGKIVIDQQSEMVQPGDTIFIPSNAEHGIHNIGDETLIYITANKSFGKEKESSIWSNNFGQL